MQALEWLGQHWQEISSILGILSFVLLIPAAILSNLLTPKFQNWWAQRSKASAQRRIANLESELSVRSSYKHAPAILLIHLFREVLRCLIFLGFALIWVLSYIWGIRIVILQQLPMDIVNVIAGPQWLVFLIDILGILCIYRFCMIAMDAFSLANDVLGLDNYRSKTEQIIAHLKTRT